MIFILVDMELKDRFYSTSLITTHAMNVKQNFMFNQVLGQTGSMVKILLHM
jgi:hypothetical protein